MRTDNILLGIFIVAISGILIVLCMQGCANKPLMKLDNGFEQTARR